MLILLFLQFFYLLKLDDEEHRFGATFEEGVEVGEVPVN